MSEPHAEAGRLLEIHLRLRLGLMSELRAEVACYSLGELDLMA